MKPLLGLVTELRRRKTFRAAGIYIVAAWVAVQVASLVFPAVGIADSALLYVWLIVLFVFPLVIVFAWRYDVSAAGLTRTPPARADDDFDPSLRRTDYAIISVLAVVAISVSWQLTTRVEPMSEVVHAVVNPNSIAVLPFDNISGDPEQEYFTSGMQAALISGLSRIRALRVTSKTSTLRYKNSDDTLAQVGRQLNVSKVVEGSIFRFKNRVRLEVRLLDAEKDAHIWSATFEDEIEDILVLQSRAAQAIAGQVRVMLSPDEQAQFDDPGRMNPAAYDAFLKGMFYVERFTPADFALAASYFQQAVELAPDHALPYWGLAKHCYFEAQNGEITPAEAHEKCLPLNLKALDLDPLLPEAYLGYAAHMTWQQFDWDAAGVAFERAIEINPSYAEARMFYSHFLTLTGDFESGWEQMRLALELDPLNPFVQALHGAQLFQSDRIEEAIEVTERVLAANPGFGFGDHILWMGYHEIGELDKSISAAAQVFRKHGYPNVADLLEQSYANGDYAGALLETAAALEELFKTTDLPPYPLTKLYELAGEVEKSIDWWEVCFRGRYPGMPYLVVETKSDAIRRHPRFIALLRELELDYWADKFSQP
jgi:TolB-like protein